MLSVIVLIVMLYFMLCWIFFMPSDIMLNDILLSDIMLSIISHYAECLYAMLNFLIAECHCADFIMLNIMLYFMKCRMSLY
jgi:hypothetical protein